MKKIKSRLLISLIWPLTCALAFAIGLNFQKFSKQPDLSSLDLQKEWRESGYQYINPLLECAAINSTGNAKLNRLGTEVSKFAESVEDQRISLYYRDLLNGPWYGYHENDTFAPQSLLKLPIIFAYLKIADENPQVLENEIEYSSPIDSNLPAEEQLKPGEKYSVDFLITRTIELSDNTAFNLLVNNLPTKYVEQVHADLNIPYPSESTPTDFVSVRSYSSIFRVLYNSSYLSRKHSEYLLSLLVQSDFSQGLVAGIENKVPVAHKFGIRNATDKDYTTQLHDCGIIYEPENPYVLCVMTKGKDQSQQAETIKKMSALVYSVITED